MYVARILYPVEVLGPGKRIGIWFCGCPHKCKGCSNPELWDFQEKYKTSLEAILTLIETIAKEHQVDGFTITGGDPMYQASDLQKLIMHLCKLSSDILVYIRQFRNSDRKHRCRNNTAGIGMYERIDYESNSSYSKRH